MKHVSLSLLALWSFFLLSETHGQHPSDFSEEWKQDVLQADFKCPFIFGSFPDPEDCQSYYVCMAGKAFHKTCTKFLSFDFWSRRCVPTLIATCRNKKDKSSTPVPETTVTDSTTKGDNFVCTSFMGVFPHPDDCSKYYSCMLYRPSIKTCPEKELFDAVQKSCQPADQVHCGTRQRPVGYTTAEVPDVTTDSTEETDATLTDLTPTSTHVTSSVKKETDTTVTDVTPSVTEEPTDNTVTESVPITSTEMRPPDHDCNENDLDCIIDETGDANDWFKCPADVGSYPHPSSDKLFIFCMNWIPYAKKCGQNLVFSKELMTCIETFL